MQDTIPRLSAQAPPREEEDVEGAGEGKEKVENSTPYPKTSEKSQILLLENGFPNGKVGSLPPIRRIKRSNPILSPE